MIDIESKEDSANDANFMEPEDFPAFFRAASHKIKTGWMSQIHVALRLYRQMATRELPRVGTRSDGRTQVTGAHS